MQFIASIAFRPQFGLDIMLCCIFYAGASIRACHSVGCHIVALGAFSALLAPMVHFRVISSPPQPQVAQRF
jgi:hypothetical protein